MQGLALPLLLLPLLLQWNLQFLRRDCYKGCEGTDYYVCPIKLECQNGSWPHILTFHPILWHGHTYSRGCSASWKAFHWIWKDCLSLWHYAVVNMPLAAA